MLKNLSGCSEAQLAYLLARVREIAALGDEAALIETDKMVWEIMEEEGGVNDSVSSVSPPTHQSHADHDEWQRNYYHEQRMRRIRSILPQFAQAVRDGNVDDLEYYGLRGATLYHSRIPGDGLDHDPTDDEEWVALKAECLAVLGDASELRMEKALEVAASRQLKNVNSVGSMIDEVERVTSESTDIRPLNEEINQKIRAVKERGARFRWNKKIGDAEVAEAAGFVGKALGLRKEAEALLVKDWEMVFPSEKPPVE